VTSPKFGVGQAWKLNSSGWLEPDTGAARLLQLQAAQLSNQQPVGNSIAMRGADGDTLAAGGPAATEHGGAGVGLHARPEPVSFRTVAAVGLKSSFGHGNPLLFSKENLFVSNCLSISQANFGIHPTALSRCGKGTW
jgi:hypothetical protein